MSNRKRKSSFSSEDGTPSKKPKLAEGLLKNPQNYRIEFQKGQITKMTLTNWVTFDHTVIDCEPGLNLIVGPNGTGKSSIVCAIGLGLAGKPKCLGRGEKISDFIKYGRDKAITCIELFNPDGANHVIKRVISRKGDRSPWSLNGRKTTAAKIDDFVKNKLNIKVDNLCQFLAQDRVSEFARLSPKDLLMETEKAVEDQRLYKWHRFLIEKGQEASTKQTEITNLQKTLAQNESEIASLQKTIEQFESRKVMQAQMKDYNALYEWEIAKKKHKEWKHAHKQTERIKAQYAKKRGNVEPLRLKLKSWSKKAHTMGTKHAKLLTDMKKLDRQRTSHSNALGTAATKIESIQDRIKQVAQDMKANERLRKKCEAEIEKMRTTFNEMDAADIEEAKQEKNRISRGELRKARTDRNNADKQLRNLTHLQNQLNMKLNDIEGRLANFRNSSQRRDSHIFDNRHRNDKKFFDWVNSQRHRFRGEVYGPIVREMTVRDDTHATFLNNSIGQSTFYGYVCTDGEDWKMVSRQSKAMNLYCTIYTSTNNSGNDNNHNNNNNNNGASQQYIRRPVDRETLRRNGVDGYLDELFEAPDFIKRVLNTHCGLHQRAYAMQDLEESSLDNVLLMRGKQPGRLNYIIMPNAVYNVKPSHYSSDVMRSLSEVRRHRYPTLRKTKDYSQQILAAENEKQEMNGKLEDIQTQQNSAHEAKKAVTARLDGLNTKKKQLEDKINRFNKVRKQLMRKESRLEELESNMGDPTEMREKLTAQIEKANMQRIERLDKLSYVLEQMFAAMKRADALQMAKKHCEEERKHVDRCIKQIQKRHQELKKALDQSVRNEKKLHEHATRLLQKVRTEFPRNVYEAKWSEEDLALSLDAIQDKINHLQGRINVLFIDEERVERYRRLEKKIATQKDKLQRMESAQNKKTDSIKNIEDKWAPQLQEAVDKISQKFGEFFAQFNKAEGRIILVREMDGQPLKYSEWHIDIETKFRSDQPFKRLTSSSQSGGEKSVSTMLYLLSLQQVTTVPFRVVDEINQGMDPINERRIMQILNFECTPAARHRNRNDGVIRHLPQYFVVTPKLLPRLQYSPCSNVFVIFNGPFQMPQEYWELPRFMESQKALTGAVSQSAIDNENDEDETDDVDDEDNDSGDNESDEESDEETN